MEKLFTPMTTAYLLVTDLHWTEKNLRGRRSYTEETKHSFNHLVQVIQKYKSLGCKVVLLFGGDIFHISYNTVFGAVAANNRMVALRSMVDGMYATIGNHELTYYKDNPFWTLLMHLDSQRVLALRNKISQPVGEIHVVDVVDELVDGDVRFIFNHYGTGVQRPTVDGKKNIGLFHQDLYSKAILEDMEYQHGQRIFEHTPTYFDNTGVFYGYDFAYMMHMHMFYGRWDYECEKTGQETKLVWLSTLGRTNHREVNDRFLERDIPAIIVEDGKFAREERNTFNLLPRSDCIVEEVIQETQKAREDLKLRKKFRETYTKYVDDPMENLEISLTEKPALLMFFREMKNTGTTKLHEEYKRELGALRWM